MEDYLERYYKSEADREAHLNAEYMRVFGLPRNDIIHEIDGNAIYGFSYNLFGRGWYSEMGSWEYLFGLHRGLDNYKDVIDEVITEKHYDLCTTRYSAFFVLDANQQPIEIISTAEIGGKCVSDRRLGHDIGSDGWTYLVISDLTLIGDDSVEPLKFEV